MLNQARLIANSPRPKYRIFALSIFILGSLAVPLEQGRNASSGTHATIVASSLPLLETGTDGRLDSDGTVLNETRSFEGSGRPNLGEVVSSSDEKARAVSPGMFHTPFRVQCHPPTVVLDMPGDPALYPQVLRNTPGTGNTVDRERLRTLQSRPNYPEMVASGEITRAKMIKKLANLLLRCRHCHCNEAGEIVPDARTDVTHKRCPPTDDFARSCQLWYKTFSAHFDALNRLPQRFRDLYPEYEWQPPSGPVQASVRPAWARAQQIDNPADLMPLLGVERGLEYELDELRQFGLGRDEKWDGNYWDLGKGGGVFWGGRGPPGAGSGSGVFKRSELHPLIEVGKDAENGAVDL
ncbi:hypothetical protein TWF481_000083 [Arthrobotrys musiformis]|uniref:Uncharacterized protein n=1 Tax=Arthrobotrys musiformis TaxID=47236 RepID=A0AAV9WLP4_9PEZI